LVAATAGGSGAGGVLGYLAFAVATVCLTHAVFFGEDRYHIVTTPVICILAACALRRTGERSRGAEAVSRQETSGKSGSSIRGAAAAGAAGQ
jgi:hypothetical protein